MKGNWTRRHFLAAGTTTASSFFMPSMARALGSATLGEKQLTTVSDGHLTLPISFTFPDAPADELAALLKASGQPATALEPDCNVTVLRDGERVILFDVGSGHNFMPTAGKLLDNLDAAGFTPEDITDVLFTHAHPDHIWGLVDDFDELVFPNASYAINQVEWDFWLADATLDNMPDARKSFVIGARNRFEFLADSINFFGYGDEVLPGIEAVDTSGHTPGHTAFAIHAGSDSMLVGGDALTNFAISFAQPGWPSGSDQDAGQGIASRLKLLDRLVADKQRLIGFHLPGSGIGRVEADGNAYRFVPEA
jgi:glyoxylase-like metal-dependent hydrolase (beta-lactamase superfamily II)